MRKYDAIDLVLLKSKMSHNEWNAFLTQCYSNHDISSLVKARYGIQAGMADLAKHKLNSPDMIDFFIRLERSIENTIKDIVREKNPNPYDNPLNKQIISEAKSEKKQRDDDLELYLIKSGY